MNNTTEFAYDARNRLTVTTYPDQATSTRRYDSSRGRLDYILDQNNNQTSYAYG